MDRFIEKAVLDSADTFSYLKSNMDRFIDFFFYIDKDVETNLKSNMDRFIVKSCINNMTAVSI